MLNALYSELLLVGNACRCNFDSAEVSVPISTGGTRSIRVARNEAVRIVDVVVQEGVFSTVDRLQLILDPVSVFFTCAPENPVGLWQRNSWAEFTDNRVLITIGVFAQTACFRLHFHQLPVVSWE